MTCRRPTISTRIAVLERLAQANRDDSDAPDSTEFAPVSWGDIERSSFTEGLEDLLAHEEERVAEEERRKVEEVREQALQRALQRAKARRWEQEQIERARAQRLEQRIECAKKTAQEEAEDELADRRAIYDARLQQQAVEEGWEQEMTAMSVQRSKRKWSVLVQSTLAAAALSGVIGLSALSSSRSNAADELAAQWDLAADHQMAAQTRVAELEAEIERRVNLTQSERLLLEEELREAQLELAEAEKEREDVDRRRQQRPTTPSRLARTITPKKKAPTKVETKVSNSSDPGTVRVASDDLAPEHCLPGDPLCFGL